MERRTKPGGKSSVVCGVIILLICLLAINYNLAGILVVGGCIAMIVFHEISLRRIFNMMEIESK